MFKKTILVAFFISFAINSYSGDWSNNGGNSRRNGQTDNPGPTTEDLLWSGGRNSIIAWQPVTEGARIFLVRQNGWPGDQNDSLIVAMDLITGEELWIADVPYHTNDWTIWIAGVNHGLLFASRSGNGASVSDNLFAFDVTDGQQLWISEDLIDSGPYDGVVFAENGDPVIASFTDIWRIRATDGITEWRSDRMASVSGNCGGAIHNDALYVSDSAAGGQIIVKYDLSTGDRLYESPVMAGFLNQNTPMIGPDGAIYLNRVQNNSAVDFFYAFSDDGLELKQKWNTPAHYGTWSEFCISPDNSIYMVAPGPLLARLNPDDGSIQNSYPLDAFTSARMAVDALGNVFFSNSGFSNGKVSVFSADLTPLWDTDVPNINIGGPAIGYGGVMVVCGVGTDVRVYCEGGPPSTPTPSPVPTHTAAPATQTPSATQTPQPTNTPYPTSTPIELGVRIEMPAHVKPDDPFFVKGFLDNPGETIQNVRVFFILDIFEQYWFWDDWTCFDPLTGDIDFVEMDAVSGTTCINVFSEFAWPNTGDSEMMGLRFWGAMMTAEMTAIIGKVAMVEWGFGPR